MFYSFFCQIIHELLNEGQTSQSVSGSVHNDNSFPENKYCYHWSVGNAPLNTTKKFGGKIVFWMLNLFLSGARWLWVIFSKISTQNKHSYSINLPLYTRHNLPWANPVMGHKGLYLCAMGKAVASCEWADGSHGEADDHCDDVQSLRITQVGGKLDRKKRVHRTHEELQHKPNVTFLQICFWPWHVYCTWGPYCKSVNFIIGNTF